MTPDRLRAVRSRLRDLAAGSAFAAVALSGAVPLGISIGFGLAFILSLIGLRPLARLRTVSVLVLLAGGALLFGAALRGLMDLVVAAVSFASLVAAQRLLSEPSQRTDQQVLLASLLLVAGGAALSGEVWFAACLMVFGLCACLTLGLQVLDDEAATGAVLRAPPVAPVLRQLTVGVLLALVGGLVFFVAFPRLSWNLAARRTPPGLFGATAGMSDRVRLGGAGTIKTSVRVVARAELTPDPGVDRLNRYWVGRRFDTFDGREWIGAGAPEAPRFRVQVSESAQRLVTQRISLLPAYDSRTLIALDRPVLFDGAFAMSTTGSAASTLVYVPDEEVHFTLDANAYAYTAFSRETVSDDESPAGDLGRYLTLPEDLDPRVAELAASVGTNLSEPGQVAAALETHLRTAFAYTLEQGDAPPDADPLADFLFVRRAGHCEHFATAMAVLLRARKIPSRVVGGFFGGERLGDTYVLRAGDAHAWTEAHLAGRGWVRFDATPDTGRASRLNALLADVTALYEQLEEVWRSSVIDYSIFDQLTFVRGLVRQPRIIQDELRLETPRARGWALGALALIALMALWRLLARPRGPGRHPATAFLTELETRLRRAGLAPEPGEGIEEAARRLSRVGHPAAGPLTAATTRYLEARFVGRGFRPGERSQLLADLEPALKPTKHWR